MFYKRIALLADSDRIARRRAVLVPDFSASDKLRPSCFCPYAGLRAPRELDQTSNLTLSKYSHCTKRYSMIRMTLRMEDATLVVLAALLQRLTQPVPGWLPHWSIAFATRRAVNRPCAPTLTWSERLLDRGTQILLERLAVFEGSSTAICSRVSAPTPPSVSTVRSLTARRSRRATSNVRENQR